jgi:predicted membrane-bound dolichyl-phosphate-mannose-protein mannosyltransferase
MAGKNKSLFWALTAILSILVIYYVRMYSVAPQIFSFTFSQTRIEQYFKSQDITRHVKGRVYLSDEDIHMAAGYLYVYGFDPTAYNFQHPPLIKYFYGYTIRFLGNPYLIQLFFGSALLALTYFGALLLTKKTWVAYLACLFLIADPVFTDLSQHALLDLGQAVFAFGYVLAHIYMPGSFVLQGILLGAFAASKFWSTSLFFVMGIAVYKLLQKKFNPRQFGLHVLIGFLTFCAVYVHSFIYHAPFNIIFFPTKNAKILVSPFGFKCARRCYVSIYDRSSSYVVAA